MKTKEKIKTNTWEIKSRTYLLKQVSPVAYMLRSSDIYWFDEDKGYERELKVTSNQKTPCYACRTWF